MENDIITILRKKIEKFTLFRLLSEPEIDAFLTHCTYQEFSPGEVLFNQGERNHYVYIVMEGRLGVFVDGQKVNEVTEGDAFGEMGILRERPKSATIIASQPCNLLVIHQMKLYELQPKVLNKLISYFLIKISDRFIQLEQKYLDLQKEQHSVSTPPKYDPDTVPHHPDASNVQVSKSLMDIASQIAFFESKIESLSEDEKMIQETIHQMIPHVDVQTKDLSEIKPGVMNLVRQSQITPILLIMLLIIAFLILIGVGLNLYILFQVHHPIFFNG